MTSTESPRRGEIWLTALGSARTGEPGNTRPTLVLSPESLMAGTPRDLVLIAPISSSFKESRLSPALTAGALDTDSVAVVRALRGIARSRMLKRLGSISPGEQMAVDRALIVALGLAER